MLLAECARGPEPVGGTAALVDALVAACRDAGVELRLGTEAKHIRLSPTGVEGVELADGETIAAGVVASAEDPGHTLLELVPGARLPPPVERAVATWRTRGSSAMLLVALSAPPRFPGCARGAPAGIPERIIAARGLRELERTADHLKYGRLPEEPWLDVRVWSVRDPDCAPAGAATLSVLMHGVPYALDGGWSEDARTRLVAAGLARLEHLAPGVRDALVACELLTPVDLEERYATAGGHLHRGELALDQLWLQRPSLALSRYATPIPGLYLCGSASHPGGPFLGGAGALAARSVLAG